MAENKKSFVLYSDLIKSIEHLTNEEKGILFNHLLEYVNDMNPILSDRLILTAWKPIELQLKRDLIKFEEKKEKRSLAGKAGADKRWQQITNDSKRIKSIAKIAVNVNDNVNDNVIYNIEQRKLKFAESLKPFLETYGKEMLNDFYLYWTEHDDNDKKFRREKEKSFSIGQRLERWNKNNFNQSKQQIKDDYVTNVMKQINK